MALLGPMYARDDGNGQLTIGLSLLEPHMNQQEAAHGGFLATLADNAMGVNASRFLGRRVATANLSIDYLAPMALGEWIEVGTRIEKSGKRLVFAECTGCVSQRSVFKARGIFAVLPDSPATRTC